MWLLIFGITILVCIVGIIYLINAISRFGLIKKISKTWQRKLVSALILVCAFTGFMFWLGLVNAMAILLYVLLFFILSGIIVRIIQKMSGKKSDIYWQGWIAIVISIVHLSCAYYMCHAVTRTDYDLSSDKEVGELHIALIADSHLGTTFDGEGFAKEISKIEAQSPDLLLIAGDFVDNDSCKKDMVRACEALGDMNLKYGVYFVYGNHDKHTFNGRDFSAKELEDELIKNNVYVLEDEIVNVDNICIAGRKDNFESQRKDIFELLKDCDEGKYIIVIDHQPTDYECESKSAADLVVSGHTHGGQLLLIKYLGEFFGINDQTYGYERINSTDFIVTSGISDWALDFKTGVRSEYVMINVNQ